MSHKFGNIDSWTKEKLDRVRKYIDAYTIALKFKNFHLEYIDAFAGTGYVTRKLTIPSASLFEDEELVSMLDFIDGSARIALQTNPTFERYTFIEKSRRRCNELSKLRIDFPSLASSIEIVNGEANDEVQKLCRTNWIASRRRAVMFLDPYGTQVKWETLKSIADTQAIDLWILFPIGAVNRLLNRNGQIREERRRRLTQMFGDETWFDAFFETQENHQLFGDNPNIQLRKIATFDRISDYFVTKLKTIFSDAVTEPFYLTNSSNSPIFLLCFAAGNPTGTPIAVKIARDILKKR